MKNWLAILVELFRKIQCRLSSSKYESREEITLIVKVNDPVLEVEAKWFYFKGWDAHSKYSWSPSIVMIRVATIRFDIKLKSN